MARCGAWRPKTRTSRSVRRSRTSSCRAPTRSWKRSAAWRRIEMAIDVTMPQMGESVVEGTIAKWLVKEGDVVIEDQPLVEISTDKVDTEIPSPGAGRIARIVVHEGETVGVGTKIAEISDKGAATGASSQPAPASSASAVAAPSVQASPAPEPQPATVAPQPIASAPAAAETAPVS